jgi:hypothetical protein
VRLAFKTGALKQSLSAFLLEVYKARGREEVLHGIYSILKLVL